MTAGNLFVSFWNICLDNLPEGGFARRRVSAADAKGYIEEARRNNLLLCVTDDDLLAPYRKRERKQHKELCDVLEEHFGISLPLSDFAGKAGDDGLYFINPLRCVQVTGGNRLLVVTCSYTRSKKKTKEPLSLEIAPDSVEFHLIESIALERSTTKAAVGGLWKDRGIDGVDYQRALRAEWDRE
jgi:hypothetical protein